MKSYIEHRSETGRSSVRIQVNSLERGGYVNVRNGGGGAVACHRFAHSACVGVICASVTVFTVGTRGIIGKGLKLH